MQRSDIAPIQAASARGDLDSVIALVESLAPNQFTIDVSCGAAVKHGHLQVARYLFSKGASLDKLASWAMESIGIPVLELLVEFGWDVNARHLLYSQALRYSVWDESVVRWLLDRGVDPNVGVSRRDPNKRTIISNSGQALEAAACSSISVFDLLLEHGAILDNAFPLHIIAATKNKIPMMKHLLELGVDVNRLDDRNPFSVGTALDHAILWSSVEHVRFLLENGASPHSSLYLAERTARSSGSQEVVNLVKQALGPP